MALGLRKEPAAGVETPDSAHEAFFVDESGIPQLKDSNGVVRPAVSISGQPLALSEQGSAPPTVANTVKLYAKDVSGISEFFVLDDLGHEVQVTKNGAVNAATGAHILWKGGTPGNCFINGDTANPTYNDIVMTNVASAESVTINLPVMTSADEGKLIGVTFTLKVGNGFGVLQPQVSDTVFGNTAGTSVNTTDAAAHHTYILFADGNGGWWMYALGLMV